MTTETLPSQRTTWAKLSTTVEEFDAWRQRTDRSYAGDDAELLCYLTDQLRAEGASLEGVQINHPVLGLLSHMSESNNRMQELVLAYLSLAVAGDSQPAKKLIAGQRLHMGLHPDYVASTCCYGSQEAELGAAVEDADESGLDGADAAVVAIQFALEDEDGMQFLRLWNEGDFDVIRREWPDVPEAVFIGADPLYKPA